MNHFTHFDKKERYVRLIRLTLLNENRKIVTSMSKYSDKSTHVRENKVRTREKPFFCIIFLSGTCVRLTKISFLFTFEGALSCPGTHPPMRAFLWRESQKPPGSSRKYADQKQLLYASAVQH